MEGNMSHVAIPFFDGESYDLWAVRMQTYLEGLDLWELVEEDDVLLSENLTVAQIKAHKDKKMRKAKVKSCLFAGVSQMIMTKIMTLKSPKEIWEYLKAEYEGNKKIRAMKVLNLIREFEMQRMKESETIKEYSNKLVGIVNKIKWLGKEFPDSRLVEKIMVTVPKRYEASITFLGNTKDLFTTTLTEVIHALQAQEQRRLMREDHVAVEGNLNKRNKYNNTQVFSSCPHCKKKGHQPNWCWWRPYVKCHKCGQLGHMKKVCKYQDSPEDVKIVKDKSEEELLLSTSCVTTNEFENNLP